MWYCTWSNLLTPGVHSLEKCKMYIRSAPKNMCLHFKAASFIYERNIPGIVYLLCRKCLFYERNVPETAYLFCTTVCLSMKEMFLASYIHSVGRCLFSSNNRNVSSIVYFSVRKCFFFLWQNFPGIVYLFYRAVCLFCERNVPSIVYVFKGQCVYSTREMFLASFIYSNGSMFSLREKCSLRGIFIL